MTDRRESMQWVWRGTALGVLLLGWIFIAWQNHFHITAPAVFVCLAYLAVVVTVYNLWRTGAAAVAAGDEEVDSTWAKQTGALGELEREKRTLLKAIKEAEFDHQMGKLSKHDVDEMIRVYRARAIEVIKEIDQLGAGTGSGGTPREQIMREVRARLELDAKAGKKATEPVKGAADAAKADVAGKGKKRGKGAAKADAAQTAAVGSAEVNSAAAADAASEPSTAPAEASEPAAAAAKGAASLDDEAMDADSTTTVESTRNHHAKEATP
jgi:hypothetical protein